MSAVTPLAPQRAARIATQLIELIELQKLIPGDKLPPERQLADLLEVSRPSLREALHFAGTGISADKAWTGNIRPRTCSCSRTSRISNDKDSWA